MVYDEPSGGKWISYPSVSSCIKVKSRSIMSNPLRPHGLYSLPGSSVHGILQARTLEWAAVPFSRDLPDPGIEAESLTLQADSLPSESL